MPLQDGGSIEKLVRRYYGPFPIKKKHTSVSYELDLNQGTKIHPIFYITLVELATQYPNSTSTMHDDPSLIHLEPK